MHKDDPSKWPWGPENKALSAHYKDLAVIYATMDLSKTAELEFKLSMRSKAFPQFLAEFQTLANRCNKTEEEKVEQLKRRVPIELAEKMANQVDVPAENNFAGWANMFQKLWDRQQENIHYMENSAPNTVLPTYLVNRLIPVNTGDPMKLDAFRSAPQQQQQRTPIARMTAESWVFAFIARRKATQFPSVTRSRQLMLAMALASSKLLTS